MGSQGKSPKSLKFFETLKIITFVVSLHGRNFNRAQIRPPSMLDFYIRSYCLLSPNVENETLQPNYTHRQNDVISVRVMHLRKYLVPGVFGVAEFDARAPLHR